jgi:hypothetical protein
MKINKDFMIYTEMIIESEGKKYNLKIWECRFCSPDGTVNTSNDGYICDECGGMHFYEEFEELL